MSTDPTLVPPGTLPTTFIPTTSAGKYEIVYLFEQSMQFYLDYFIVLCFSVGYMVMSYPGRPQMVPGIPMPQAMGMPYMQIGGM